MSHPGRDRDGASARIRQAAIALFRARGYHGTSVRELAQIVRIEAASLYYHFPSKQKILFDVFNRTMDDLLEGLRRALTRGASPEERLRAIVHFHVRFHVERQDEAFISHSELRSLTGSNLRRIIAKRDRYERTVRKLLSAGVRAGIFHISDVRLATIAILMMCSGVSDWFTERGRLDAATVADRYADMVLRVVGFDRSRAPRPAASEVWSLTSQSAVGGRRRGPVGRRRRLVMSGITAGPRPGAWPVSRESAKTKRSA